MKRNLYLSSCGLSRVQIRKDKKYLLLLSPLQERKCTLTATAVNLSKACVRTIQRRVTWKAIDFLISVRGVDPGFSTFLTFC